MGSRHELDDLLQPRLRSTTAHRAPYSPTATFLTSFFGGAVGAALVGALNGGRLGKPRWELALAFCFALAGLTFMFQLGRWLGTDSVPEWLPQNRNARYLNNAVGAAFAGVFWLLHRAERKAFQLSSAEPPKAWPMVLSVLGLSVALNLLALVAGLSLA